MSKINSYALFCLAALVLNSSDVLCSSFSQPDNDINLHSLSSSAHNTSPRSNPAALVSQTPINASNMLQGATYGGATEPFIFNEANPSNNNLSLSGLLYRWYFNAAVHTLLESTLPSTPYNGEATSTHMSSVIPPMVPQMNANNAIDTSSDARHDSGIPFSTWNAGNLATTSANANRNVLPSSMVHELNPIPLSDIPPLPCTQPQAVVAANQDKSHALPKKNKKPTKTYICPTCNKMLANRSSFRYHLRTHNRNRERPYKCNICDKSFAEKSILKNHINRHSKEKLFKCDFCSMRFKTKPEKTIHHRTHTKEKPYKCDTCGKCFGRKSILKIHIRIHTGEKPYKCDICQQGLSSKEALAGHIDWHRGIKRYSCEECKKSFRKKSSLKEHYKLHKDKSITNMLNVPEPMLPRMDKTPS